MREHFTDYELAAAALLIGAVLLLSLTLFTNRGDLTSATLALCGVGCFVAGIYVLTFSRGEPLETSVSALLPVQGSLSVCILCADLGLQGPGFLLPGGGEDPVFFLPASSDRTLPGTREIGFHLNTEGSGVVLPPAGLSLLRLLKQEYSLALPSEEPGLLGAVEEVCRDTLTLADPVKVERSGNTIQIELSRFRLMRGCQEVRSHSPACCTLYPCPVCSLITCLLAEGAKRTVTLERTDVAGDTLRLILSFGP